MTKEDKEIKLIDETANQNQNSEHSKNYLSAVQSRWKDLIEECKKKSGKKYLSNAILAKIRIRSELRNRILIGVSAVVFVVVIWIIFDRRTPNEDTDEITRPLAQAPEGYSFTRDPYDYEKSRKILLFNPRHDRVDWGIGLGNDPFQKQECRVRNCFLTADRHLLGDSSESKFDAILYYMPGLAKEDFVSIPAFRRREQRYVMVTDSAPMDKSMWFGDELNNFFNWTMTYRMDSDLPAPAGRILHINKELVHVDHKHMIGWNHLEGIQSLSSEGISANRKKLIAWYVSDCNSLESHREDYTSFLANYVPVDIYGPCGNMECPGGHNDNAQRCTKALSTEYKFILAFEKSLCRDYISEYFYQVMNLPIVPIVMGSGDYAKMAPAKSYIDVNDFASAKELANYLLYLDDNNLAYLSHFKWKDHFRVVQKDPICGLCEMVNSNLPAKSYKDFVSWFVKRSECQKGIDMPWMIASLADEIEEKADKMVQKTLQEDKIKQLNSHLADGTVQMEDDDEFKRWKKEWRSPVVAMPGEKSAPQLQESMQRVVSALENSAGNTVTNVESKAFRVSETKRKVEDLKKTHIYRDKLNSDKFQNSQIADLKREKARGENIKRLESRNKS